MQTMPQFGTQTYMPYGMPGYYPGGTYGTFSYPGMYGMYGMPPGYGQYGMPAGQPLYGTYSYPGNTSPGYFGGYPGGYVPREPETGQSQ
ncbi:hypothetical protein PAE9249_04746 [Paenibacillus sp. CECT 9249]|nr:hypothetical protein PAE9249_04746 [Paenibacillus sp. CECT 9249]